jgi:RNA polymerase sigma-70 factor (ECF subfamily)
MTKPLEDAVEVEGLLRRVWAEGRGRWPQVELPEDVFVRHVAQLLPEARKKEELAPVLERLDREGLYLACACVKGVPGAIQALEDHYLAKLPGALSYLKLSQTTVDDVCQLVREHLLVGTAEAGPKLAGYTGRGALLTWMRVTAARMAQRLSASGPEAADEDMIEALPAPDTDVEFELNKRHYRQEFRQALREAFTALSSEQRYLLRLHFMEQLPTTRIAPLFGKDQSTISRWLKEARQKVYEETKQRLRERLGLSSLQFESHTNALASHFDMSLSQFLADDEPADTPGED